MSASSAFHARRRRGFLGLGLFALSVLAGSAPARAQIEWLGSIEEARDIASRTHRLVLVHFWSESCGPCMKLDQTVFRQRAFSQSLGANYAPVKINVAEHQDLARLYRVERIPTDIILTPDGREVHRSISPGETNGYVRMLDQVAAHARVAMRPPNEPSSDAAGDSVPVNGLEPAWGPNAVHSAPRPANPAQASGRAVENPFVVPAPRVESQPRAPATQSAGGPGPGPSADASRYAPSPEPNDPRASAATRTMQDLDEQPMRAAPPGSPSRYSISAPPLDARPASRGGATAPHGFQADPSRPGADPRTGSAPVAASPDAPPGTGGAPPGLEGYCPVSLVEERAWKAGNPQWIASHEGRIYFFASPGHQQAFTRDPRRYAPALAGFDVVLHRERGILVPGQRRHGVAHRGRYYLFADETTLERFWQAPAAYESP